VTYRQQQQAQEQAEKASSPQEANSTQDEVLNIFKSLTKVLSDNNKQLHSSDVSEPQKFFGHDSHWEDWYLQWRTYLEAKGWLTTFEHPTGPGTVGFDNEINKKIYNKLLSVCQKGTASTYVTKAAHCNGWEAAKYLLERY
jgi:malate synthase